MKLEDQIYLSCASYSSIHPNRAAVLNHLFCVLGNGYEWENGALVECCGETTYKNGKRMSINAAINSIFRRRRKNNEWRQRDIRNFKRREKRAFTHSATCPIITKCNCGSDPHDKWCCTFYPGTEICNCGAQARINAARPKNDKLDKMVEEAIAAMKKAREANPVGFEEKRKKQAEEFAAQRKKWNAEKRWEYRIPTDIAKRVKDTSDFDHWYPISMSYPSNLLNFPDDIKTDWLKGIIETCELIAASYDRFEKGGPAFTNYGLAHDADGTLAKKATRATYVVANAALHRAQDLLESRKKKRITARRRGIK